MTRTAKTNARIAIAAALASALTLGTAAMPALAQGTVPDEGVPIVAQSEEIGGYTAIDIAQDYLGIDDWDVAYADWEESFYFDKAVYEVTIVTRAREGWGYTWIPGETWVVEVGAATGVVYAAWTV